MHIVGDWQWQNALPEEKSRQKDVIPRDSASLQCLADPSDATVAYLKRLATDRFKLSCYLKLQLLQTYKMPAR